MADEFLSDESFHTVMTVMFVVLSAMALGTLLLILLCTPSNMKYYSYFLLNINFWCYLAALLTSFSHGDIARIHGVLCFRINLLIHIPSLNYRVYAGISIMAMFNGYLAILSTFVYLMLRVAFPHRIKRVKWWMGFALVALLQLVVGGMMAYSGSKTFAPISEMNITRDETEDDEFVCVSEQEQLHSLIVASISQIVAVSVLLVVIIAVIVRKMKTQNVSAQTQKLQRMLLKTLIITALIPIVCKSFPSLLTAVAMLKHWPELISFIRLGSFFTTIQAISNGLATFFCIRCYRDKLKKWTFFWRRDQFKINNVSTF